MEPMVPSFNPSSCVELERRFAHSSSGKRVRGKREPFTIVQRLSLVRRLEALYEQVGCS
jgi:hypothetical protein